jgi:hypothetical protein
MLRLRGVAVLIALLGVLVGVLLRDPPQEHSAVTVHEACRERALLACRDTYPREPLTPLWKSDRPAYEKRIAPYNACVSSRYRRCVAGRYLQSFGSSVQ